MKKPAEFGGRDPAAAETFAYVTVERLAPETLCITGNEGGAYDGLSAHVFSDFVAPDDYDLSLCIQAASGGCPEYTDIMIPADGLGGLAVLHVGDAPVGDSVGMVRDGIIASSALEETKSPLDVLHLARGIFLDSEI